MQRTSKSRYIGLSLLAGAIQSALAASTIALPDTAPSFKTGTVRSSADNYLPNFNTGTDANYVGYPGLQKWYGISYIEGAACGDTTGVACPDPGLITLAAAPWNSGIKALKFNPAAFSTPKGKGIVQYILPLNLKLNTRYKIHLTMGLDNVTGTTATVDLRSMVGIVNSYITTSSVTKTLQLKAGTPTDVTIEGIVTTPDGEPQADGRSIRLFPAQLGTSFYISAMSVEEVNVNPLNMAEDKAFGKPTAATPLLMDRKMFGLHVNELGSHNGWTNLGQEVLRLWGTDGSYWFRVQPTADSNTANWNWSLIDYHVNYFKQDPTTTPKDPLLVHNPSGDIIYTLGQTPRWATDFANANGGPSGCAYSYPTTQADGAAIQFGACAAPNTLAAFRAYVTGVATRYKDSIKYFEIWNEPAPGNFYQGTPERLAELTHEARLALDSVKAGQKLIGPAADGEWMDRYLTAGAGNDIDIYNFHGYITPYRVETDLVAAVGNVKLKMAEYGLGNKPIWNTESGAHCGPNGSSCTGIRPAQNSTQWLLDQQGLLPRSLAVQWANGVSNMDYFFLEGWDEGWTALVSRPGPTLPYSCSQSWPYYCSGKMPATPLGKGYSKASEWLKGTKLYSAYKMADQDIYIFKLRTANGAQRYLVWNASTTTKQVSAPLSWNIKTVSYIDTGMVTKTLNYSLQPFTLEPRYPVLLAPAAVP